MISKIPRQTKFSSSESVILKFGKYPIMFFIESNNFRMHALIRLTKNMFVPTPRFKKSITFSKLFHSKFIEGNLALMVIFEVSLLRCQIRKVSFKYLNQPQIDASHSCPYNLFVLELTRENCRLYMLQCQLKSRSLSKEFRYESINISCNSFVRSNLII